MKGYCKVIIFLMLFEFLKACVLTTEKAKCLSQNKNIKITDENICCFVVVDMGEDAQYSCLSVPQQKDALRAFIKTLEDTFKGKRLSVECSSTYFFSVNAFLLLVGFLL